MRNSWLIDPDALIARALELKPLPQSAVRLAGLIGSGREIVSDVVETISFDAALTLKVIRAANSAFGGGSGAITSVSDAVVRLGTAQILAIAVASCVRSQLQQDIVQYGYTDGAFWRHSVAAAVVTEVLPSVTKVVLPLESFIAALLHDVGKIILAPFLSSEIIDLIKRARVEAGLSLSEAEKHILKVDHAEVGAVIAQHWRLADAIVKGIAFHHNPEQGGDLICDVVYLADLVAKKVEGDLYDRPVEARPIALVIERLGLNDSSFTELSEATLQRFQQVKTRYSVR